MKRGVLLLALIIMMLAGSLVFSQTYKGKGRLLGIVTDEQGNPIEGVTVKLFSQRGNAGFNVKTDTGGNWVASWIRGGEWKIDFEKVGYMPETAQVNVSEFQRNPEVSMTLKKIEGLVLTDDLKKALNEGNALFNQGQYEEALSVYQKTWHQSAAVHQCHINR